MSVDDLDVALAQAAIDAYSEATVLTSNSQVLVRPYEDGMLVVPRGTDDLVALLRDLEAARLRADPILRETPASFVEDAEEIFWRVEPLVRRAAWLAFGGHSKGASEGQDLASMFGHNGYAIKRVTVLAPAPVGTLNGALAGVEGSAWRMMFSDDYGDPVPRLPPERPHAQPLAVLKYPGTRPLDPIAMHAAASYLAGIKALRGGT